MADHADIGPSGLQQVLLCPGSYRMQKGLPDSAGPDARLGTAAHELAARCLNEERNPTFWRGETIVVDGDEFAVDDDMCEAVQTYVDYCRALPGDEFWVEQRVTVPIIDTWGTADFLKIHREERTLFVADYKHGKGVFVSGRENPQLMAYGLGAYHLLSVAEEIDIVEVAVVQPRIDNVTSERYTVAELEAWAERVAPAVREARLNPDSPLIPGDKQCRFCKAKATCPAVMAYVQETVLMEFDVVDSRPPSAITVDFATVLPRLDLVEDWCREVRAAAQKHLLAGGTIAGFKLVEGRRGNRAWSDPKAVEALMRDRFRLSKDEMYTYSLIGPPVAEKLLATESPRRWKQLAELVTQSPGKPTVAPESDRRPPYFVVATADEFTNLDEESLA